MKTFKKDPPLLVTEYLKDFNLYLIYPVFNGKPAGYEYLFGSYLEAKEFCDFWFKNSFAADTAYQIREQKRL